MSEHRVRVDWSRGERPFGPEYDRDHDWVFEGGSTVRASSAPDRYGNRALVDPEEAFVASISSCHMMWFLSLAARAGLTVDRYVDNAVGFMARDEQGVTWIQRVELSPDIHFGAGSDPDPEAVTGLHEQAHARCFVANSVRSEIVVRAVTPPR